jgi:O-antigen ligase
MPSVSAVFLVLSLVLAVAIGPQTSSWCWGPAMLALAVSVTAALPALWRKKDGIESIPLLALGFVTACWFAWRASVSPVAELGSADLMLLAGATGSFVSLRVIRGDALAGKILIWGIALLLVANVAVIAKQVVDPSFNPIYHSRSGSFPAGFYRHYNEAANYLIASSMVVAAAALFGNLRMVSRFLMAFIAVAGLVAVYFTHSRGGILGAATASMVLACTALVLAKRDGSRWFAPGLIALPLIAIAAGGFLLSGWQASQEIRQAGSGIDGLMDNSIRLYLLGLAVSTAALHPLFGGGSRSFSWDSIQLWEPSELGAATHLPRFVHNEFMQGATDYGLIGALLLAFLLGGIALTAVLRMLFGRLPAGTTHARVWLVGGCAACAGMMVQSSFSFVFHFFPGILLLGICLGMAAPSLIGIPNGAWRVFSAGQLSLVAVFSLVILVHAGIRESRVSRILWPSYVTATTSGEVTVVQLGEALEIHPRADLFIDRATLYQTEFDATDGKFTDLAERAIQDYTSASRLNPFDPRPVVNQANLLSRLGRDAEAEALYVQGIELQGGFETGFRCHFLLANHLFRKGLRLLDDKDQDAARDVLQDARIEFKKTVESASLYYKERQNVVALLENLGVALAASKDLDGALQAYDLASTIPEGRAANFWVSQTMTKIGTAAWDARKPAEALWYFNEAKRRLFVSGSLPTGVTPAQRQELDAYLDECIAYLKGARILPVDPAK